jgi:hypothetical protein
MFTDSELIRETSLALSKPIVKVIYLKMSNTGLRVAFVTAFLKTLAGAILDNTDVTSSPGVCLFQLDKAHHL